MYMWQFHASFSFANAPAVVGYVSDVFYRCLIWEIPLSKVTQKNTVFYDLRRRPYISEFSLFHGLWFLKILMGQAVTQLCMYGKHSSHLRLLCSSMINLFAYKRWNRFDGKRLICKGQILLIATVRKLWRNKLWKDWEFSEWIWLEKRIIIHWKRWKTTYQKRCGKSYAFSLTSTKMLDEQQLIILKLRETEDTDICNLL